MLDPFLPEQEEDVTRLKDIQKQIHDLFIELVKSRRESKLKTETPGLFEGDIWIGQRAVEVGLADATGHVFDVLERKFGKSVDIRPIEVSTSLWKKLGLSSQQYIPEMVLDAIEQKTHWNRFGF
jgi:serine protease SohB